MTETTSTLGGAVTEQKSARCGARAFPSCLEDLDIDFAGAPRPVLITRLLAACVTDQDGRPLDDGELWRWTLDERLQALAAIVTASRGSNVTLTVRCPHVECHETIEIDVDLAVLEPSAEAIASCHPEAETEVRLRLPTGADQLDWLAKRHRLSPAVDMATSLVTSINGEAPPRGWRAPETWLESIAAELAEHDCSLPAGSGVVCPACGQTVPLEIDIEGNLIALLATEQRRLLQDVHRIAAAYHWSEPEIVSLPRRRREFYLECIEER